jgi:hypothetical protein
VCDEVHDLILASRKYPTLCSRFQFFGREFLCFGKDHARSGKVGRKFGNDSAPVGSSFSKSESITFLLKTKKSISKWHKFTDD